MARLNSINTGNFTSSMMDARPVATNFDSGSETVKSQNEGQRIQMERERLDFNMQKSRDDKELAAMDAILKDPQNADYIARSYGITITPEMKGMLEQPQHAKLVIDGMTMAKNVGIDTPEGVRQYAAAYVQSGGDSMAALEAMRGYQSMKEKESTARATYYGRGGKAGENTAGGYKYGPLPRGTRMNTETGQVERAPGVTNDMLYKPDPFADLNDEGDIPENLPAGTQPIIPTQAPPKVTTPPFNPSDPNARTKLNEAGRARYGAKWDEIIRGTSLEQPGLGD